MLKIDDLCFAYDEKEIFSHFSFEIKKKEILCVMGKNGSGKTTLLKILSGLNYCPSLNCQIDDEYFKQNALKKMIAYIPASPEFYDTLSMKEYIIWIGTMWNMDKNFFEIVKEKLKTMQLTVDINAEISTYSLGMKYKLYFCTFLSLNKPILLLDEPFNSLDIDSRKIAIDLIKDYIKKTNGYCLFSSHVKDTISQLADKTIFI